MVSEEKNAGHYVDRETGDMMSIVKDYKVFWSTVPIEIPGEDGIPVKIGMSLVLVGTEENKEGAGDEKAELAVSDKLYNLAEWLIPKDSPNVRFEIRKHDDVVFYLPDDLRTNRKNYLVGIRILHNEQFDLPIDEHQTQILKQFESRLKELSCPKDHWKEKPTNQA
jgi:hypothetical protein